MKPQCPRPSFVAAADWLAWQEHAPNLRYVLPAENQGQIVLVSYCFESQHGVFQQVYDQSDRSVQWYWARRGWVEDDFDVDDLQVRAPKLKGRYKWHRLA